jgi:hypothetical protein
VRAVRHEEDGDYHLGLALDPAYAGLLVRGNEEAQHGSLVVEIVPADEPGCTVGQPPRPASGSYDYGTCTGADVTAPPVGARVSVTGPYVIDTVHRWAEIHPAWVIRLADARPAPVTTQAPTAPRVPPTSALSCTASMSNASPAQYSTTDVLVRTAAGATVSATAHYKSTDTTHTGTADSSGNEGFAFHISRATHGFTVEVDVQVSSGGQGAACSTSFTTQ